MTLTDRLFAGPGGALQRPTAATLFPAAQVVAVALVASLFRLLFWRLAGDSAFLHTPVVDGSFFDIWARTLAEGRVFQDQAFFKPPLYAYLLALLYRLGCDLAAVQVLQLLVGVATCVLTLALARVVLRPGQAFAAAVVTASLPILPFFEVQLLAEPWTLPLTLGGLLPLLLVFSGRIPSGARPLATAGVLLGIAALGRPNLMLGVAIAAGCLWWWGRRDGKVGAGGVVVLLAGFLLAISPATIHNLRHGEFALISANLGVNLYTGQSDIADGVSAIPVGVAWDDLQLRARQAGAQGPVASSRLYTREALAWTAAHPDRALALWVKKAVLIGNAFEGRNNINPLWLAREDGVFLLSRFWPSTWLLLPFAIVGLVFAGRGEAPWWLLRWLVLGQFVAVLPFFVAARFRVPLLPLLALFGVAGAVHLVGAFRARRWWSFGVLMLAVIYVNVDWYGLGGERWLARDHFNQALIQTRGYGGRPPDPEQAERHFRRALQLDPDDVDTNERYGALLLGQAQPLVNGALEAVVAGDAADATARIGRAEQLLGRAGHLHQRAADLYPRSVRSWANLGTCRMWQGDLSAARSRLRLAVADTGAAAELAVTALARYEEAGRALQQSLAIDRSQSALGRQMQLLADGVLALPPVAPAVIGMQERVRRGREGTQ